MKRQFLRANYVERNVSVRIRILIAPLRVVVFIMAAIRTLLAEENVHPRGQLESEKTNRRMQILQVRL